VYLVGEDLHHIPEGGCAFHFPGAVVELDWVNFEMRSMARSLSGNLRDNAAMESFFSSLKTERVVRRTCRTQAQARGDVFNYIERFHNRRAGTRPWGISAQWTSRRKRGSVYLLAVKPAAVWLGCVDKRDSRTSGVLIQDCSLGSSHGPWGLIGCRVGADRSASAI
jgi:Integrase core domain